MTLMIKGKSWPDEFHNRFFIGQHTVDSDQNSTIPGLLSKMDGRDLIRRLADVGVDAVYFYSSCHCGNCFYPTEMKLAHMHSGLNGRDVFGEAAEECEKQGMALIAVYEFMNLRISDTGPREWQHYYPEPGLTNHSTGGYSGLCWNTGYGDFVMKQIEEVASRYPIAGFYIDMLDHPGLVCCEGCARRFKEVVGVAPPRKLDPNSPLFKAFKLWTYKDEARYMNELREMLHAFHPGATLVNNSHLMKCEDLYETCEANDYLTNDPGVVFGCGGGSVRHTALISTFRALSRGKHSFEVLSDPFLCGCLSILPPEPYNAVTATITAHGGASGYPSMMIDREGLPDNAVLELTGIANNFHNQRLPWTRKGESVRFAGIYLSQESEIFYGNPDCREGNDKYKDSFWGACLVLQQAHVPTDILTRRDLGRLAEYPVIYLPNAVCFSEYEISTFKDYVSKGGILISSYKTSLCNEWNEKRENFGLAEVFGVDSQGEKIEPFIALQFPLPDGLFETESWENRDITLPQAGLLCKLRENAQSIIDLHDRYRYDPSKNSSAMHNAYTKIEPLGPGMVVNHYGKGKSIYFSGKIFSAYLHSGIPSLKKLGTDWVIGELVKNKCFIYAEAPPSVELTAWSQPDKNRVLVHLVNYQFQQGRGHLPASDNTIPTIIISVTDIKLKVKLKPDDVKRAVLQPSGKDLGVENDVNGTQIRIPKLHLHEIVELVLKPSVCPVYPDSNRLFNYPRIDVKKKIQEWLKSNPDDYDSDDDGVMDFSRWRQTEDFLTNWNFVGPFSPDSTPDQTPEGNNSLNNIYKGLEGEVKWVEKAGMDHHPDGLVEMAKVIGNEHKTVGYALAFLRSAADQDVIFHLGNDDECMIILNGDDVFTDPGSKKRCLAQDQIKFAGKLIKGVNTLLVKKKNIGHGMHFYLRLEDPEFEVFCSSRPDKIGRRVQISKQKFETWNGRGAGQI